MFEESRYFTLDVASGERVARLQETLTALGAALRSDEPAAGSAIATPLPQAA
jgi:hypothetical protein